MTVYYSSDEETITIANLSIDDFVALRELLKLGRLQSYQSFRLKECNIADGKTIQTGRDLTKMLEKVIIKDKNRDQNFDFE